MEAKVLQPLQMSALQRIQENNSRKQITYLENFQKSTAEWGLRTHLVTRKGKSHRPVVVLKVSRSSDNTPASVLESRSRPSLLDESKILKNKSEEVEPSLEGRCVYLIGMMGSGKTTVGKVLSESIGYSFYDCDSLIEQAADGISVAEIFKQYGEGFFRENETEVLYKLSMMRRLVVSTGGGAVVRPVNWKHMRNGVTVWLDVPLEALARRITAVGTDSRPLLNHGSGDPYSKTMKRLLDLFEERGEAYAKADARVSLENIASKQGIKDVCDVTPTAIAIEALVQIENFLRRQRQR